MEERTSMPFDDDTPGLKARKNRDGTIRLYWVARPDVVAQGYQPLTVRLHYDRNNPTDSPLISAACMKLQAEMLAWSAGQRDRRDRPDGTIAGEIRCYQHDPASPYRDLKWNTQRTYDQVFGVIERAFGKRALAALGIADFRRWYDEAKKPARPGGPERIRKAHGIIAMLRRLFAYGVTAEHQHCARLAAILDEARFKQPGRRRIKLDLAHVEAFIPKAIAAGRLSLALGTALQFETTMRQRDVIGEWEPISEEGTPTGIVLGNRRWVKGLTWADISVDLVISKETTKTGAVVSYDLKLCPLVIDILALTPVERRVGPLIIDETAGRPYAEHAYAREWRVIARAAEIPDTVWNMDARSGGISEADDAGADLDDIRSAAGHTEASTTARYVRGTIGKSRKVAELRLAHRTSKNGS
jgi:hypothetical protein